VGDYDAAIAIAGRYIEHAPRTRSEVERRLQRAGFEAAVIEAAVKALERAGLVDDRAFARAWVESRSRSRGYGRIRLETELRRKGVDSETISEALAVMEPDSESNRALTVARSLLGSADIADRAVRQRLAGYLHRRGYSWDTIEQVIEAIVSNE